MSRNSLYPPSVDPGFPTLGSVPSGWTRTTFGSVLEKVERPLRLEPDRKYRLVTAKRNRGGIVLRSELLGREILTKTQFVAKEGDFLISRRQIIHGACGVVPEHLDGAVVSNEYSTLRTRPGLLMDYLQHYCHTPYFQRTCFHSSHGVDVEKMIFKIDEWLARDLHLPPVEEQRKIANILSSVDRVTDSCQSVIDQTRVVKKAMMAELLTKGLPGRHKRFKPIDMAEWRLGRVNQDIAQIPESWTRVRLVDVARLESGHTPSRRHPEYWEGTVPWVSLHDTEGLDVPEIQSTAECIGELGLANSSARLLPAGTVVFSRTATIGKSTVLGREMATSQDFANYVCGPRIHNRYLMHLFRAMGAEWDRLKAGSTHKTIYMPIFEQLEVLLPSVDEQREVARIADWVDERLSTDVAHFQTLRPLKSAIMSVLLTGDLRVGAGEEAAA
jgi:type I restriction enzyme S subunit